MKNLCFWLVASLCAIFVVLLPALLTEQEPLRTEWLAEDYRSVELISISSLAYSAAVQSIHALGRGY